MSNIKDSLDAVKGILEAVPVYDDMLQPASKEVGKSLLTVAKTINLALAPLAGLVWSYEKIRLHIETSMAEKLKNIPEENITSPDPSVAVPAIQALRYTAHNEDLREMFTNLLATAMDKSTVKNAHPSFVEIIKQISSDEARIISLLTNDHSKAVIRLRSMNHDNDHYTEILQEFSILPYLAGCEHPELGPSYLNNITRLGIAEINYTTYSTFPNAYEEIYKHPVFIEKKKWIEDNAKRAEVRRGTFCRTQFGEKFYNACIIEK